MSIRKKGHINPMADQRRIAAEINRELTHIGLELRRTSLQYLAKHKINDRADLAKSIRAEVEELVNMWRLRFGSNAKHGIFVHDGTGLLGESKRPYKKFPPKKPIRSWARRKLNLKGKELDRATWFIRKKIFEKGTKPKPFLLESIKVHQPKIQARIQRAIDRGIANAG